MPHIIAWAFMCVYARLVQRSVGGRSVMTGLMSPISVRATRLYWKNEEPNSWPSWWKIDQNVPSHHNSRGGWTTLASDRGQHWCYLRRYSIVVCSSERHPADYRRTISVRGVNKTVTAFHIITQQQQTRIMTYRIGVPAPWRLGDRVCRHNRLHDVSCLWNWN